MLSRRDVLGALPALPLVGSLVSAEPQNLEAQVVMCKKCGKKESTMESPDLLCDDCWEHWFNNVEDGWVVKYTYCGPRWKTDVVGVSVTCYFSNQDYTDSEKSAKEFASKIDSGYTKDIEIYPVYRHPEEEKKEEDEIIGYKLIVCYPPSGYSYTTFFSNGRKYDFGEQKSLSAKEYAEAYKSYYLKHRDEIVDCQIIEIRQSNVLEMIKSGQIGLVVRRKT